jgi:pilus assembly protein CpaF
MDEPGHVLSTLQKQLAISLSTIAGLLQDNGVSDIYIDGADKIYVKYRDGRLEYKRKLNFESEQHLETLAELLARANHIELRQDQPFLDTVFDRQRINVVVNPVYPPGTCITIRKLPRKQLKGEDLVRLGSISADGLFILQMAVKLGKRILIVGETGSGKTTLLNILCRFIDKSFGRVITIEDTRELFFDHPFLVPLVVPADHDGDRGSRFQRILINSLRMDPAWTILGEIRGAEAVTLLDSFICHPGMATLHARGALEAITRLKTILCCHSRINTDLAEGNIFQAVDLVVFVKRHLDNCRRVVHMAELFFESGEKKIRNLFGYNSNDGQFVRLNRPGFWDELSPGQLLAFRQEVGLYPSESTEKSHENQ